MEEQSVGNEHLISINNVKAIDFNLSSAAYVFYITKYL